MKTKYFFVSLAVFAFALFAFEANAGIFQFSETDPNYLQALSIAAAQEAQEEIDIEKKLELDEDFKPEDFGLTDVGILPTSPFYFIKDIRRGVGSVFTRDPAKKTELKLKYAAEKLLETQEVAKNEGADDKDKEHAIENFKDELEEVKKRVEIASEQLDEKKSKELSKKVLDATLKYGKSLGKIEKDVSPEIYNHVKDAKDAMSEALASAFSLAEPEVVSNQIAEVLDAQRGSEFKNFKNLEVLKEVESKVPEAAKEAIKTAQGNALNKLQTELEKLEAAQKAIFEEFIKSAGGSEIRHLEIINDLETRPISKELRNVISGAKEHVFSKAEERLKNLPEGQREIYVEHLGEGNLNDIRTINELAKNMGEGVLAGISGIKSKAEKSFVEKIKSVDQNENQKNAFLGSIERFHDAKSIAVLNEIEKLIPEDKKGFFGELKSKAVQEINNDVSRAANSSQRQYVYEALAGDHPEELADLDVFERNTSISFEAGFIEGIKRAQYAIMQNRIGKITNRERLSKYEEDFKQEIPDYASFRGFFEQQKVIFESPEKALKKIKEAEGMLAEFRGARAALSYDSAFKNGEFDRTLRDIESVLAYAERRLETARTVLGYDDIGRAFSEAQSAENMARDGIELVKKYKSGIKETKCPFYYPSPQDFCTNGIVVFQNDQNGCPLPPKCEFKEIRECPNVDYSSQIVCPSGTHRESFKDDKGCYVLGKCVPDKVTCQAYFEGYVLDKNTNTCRKESVSGCTDPFIYHTLEECTKSKNQITICPAMPTVTDCSVGEHKVVIYSSRECGIYYSCEKDIPIEPSCYSYKAESSCKLSVSGCIWYANHYDGSHCDDAAHGKATTAGYCGDKICQSNEYPASCSQDCGYETNKNWIEHIWKFKDGLTEKSMVLNRTDSEYLAFISGVEKQCLGITKDKFGWKPNAGSDTPENWQNFGIPDCSGTAVSYVCGNKVCDPGETTSTCYADCGTTWVPQCSDGKDNDGDGKADYPTDSGCYDKMDDLEQDNVGGEQSMRHCFYPNASKNSASLGYTVWCEADYVNCHKGSPSGESISTTGVSLGAPSSCESGWTVSASQCSDGKDNDNDGKIDYPADTGCYGSTDNDEAMPTTTNTCNNNGICDYVENPAYGETPASCPADCGNTTAKCTYFTEATCNADVVCAWVSGFGCGSKAQCNDKIDNDKDGFVDMADSGCTDNFDNDESGQTTTTTSTTEKCTTASTCTNSTSCAGSGFYWYNNVCNTSQQTTTTTSTTEKCTTASACTNSTSCGASGFYWYNNVCNTSAQTTTTCSTPSNCFDQSICTGSGWYWYNSGCWSTPQSISNTSCSAGYYWTGTACAVNPPSTTTTTCSSDQYWNGTACVTNTTTTTTSCVSCPSPSSGCWYEGGSCSTCGTVKCPTTTTTTGGGSTSNCSTPSNCFDQSICTGSGWHWYNSGCWSSPQTTGGGANILQGFWNKLIGF